MSNNVVLTSMRRQYDNELRLCACWVGLNTFHPILAALFSIVTTLLISSII